MVLGRLSVGGLSLRQFDTGGRRREFEFLVAFSYERTLWTPEFPVAVLIVIYLLAAPLMRYPPDPGDSTPTGRFESPVCGDESSSAHQPLGRADIPNRPHNDIPTLRKNVRPRTESSLASAAAGMCEKNVLLYRHAQFGDNPVLYSESRSTCWSLCLAGRTFWRASTIFSWKRTKTGFPVISSGSTHSMKKPEA